MAGAKPHGLYVPHTGSEVFDFPGPLTGDTFEMHQHPDHPFQMWRLLSSHEIVFGSVKYSEADPASECLAIWFHSKTTGAWSLLKAFHGVKTMGM